MRQIELVIRQLLGALENIVYCIMSYRIPNYNGEEKLPPSKV